LKLRKEGRGRHGYTITMKKSATPGSKRTKHGPVTFETVRQLARALPGVEEGTSYGTPACKVRGKLFARLHQDGESLVVRIEFAEREVLLAADAETFYITNHYLNYPWILVRLAAVREDQLSELLKQAWRLVAPKRLVADFYGLIQ
jgi:hypothetical protein